MPSAAVAEIVPAKASSTQKDNERGLRQLLRLLDDSPAPMEAIESQHVRQHLRFRKDVSVRANREKALLSAIRECGYTALANPCTGVKGNKESGRDVYVEDELFAKAYKHADRPLRYAMDPTYLVGQRAH